MEYIILTTQREFGLNSKNFYGLIRVLASLKLIYINILKILRTIENYKKKVQCMIDQYNNYTSNQVNRSVRQSVFAIVVILF